MPLTLPHLSFGPVVELDQLVSSIVTDLYDASGARLAAPLSLRLQDLVSASGCPAPQPDTICHMHGLSRVGQRHPAFRVGAARCRSPSVP